MQINWYPGHMAKAKRLLQEQVTRVDAVIELCDARLPFSSRNPVLNQMLRNKARVLLLNKADLADPAKTKQWMSFFRQRGTECAAVSADKNAREVLKAIERLTKDRVERSAARGMRRTVRVMVVGVPNVGKSTLINRLHGGSVAKVGDRPGVTRANQWIRVGEYLELLDTPGMLWPRLDDPVAAKHLAYISAIRDEVVDTFALSCGYQRSFPARPGADGSGVPRARVFDARRRSRSGARLRRCAGRIPRRQAGPRHAGDAAYYRRNERK